MAERQRKKPEKENVKKTSPLESTLTELTEPQTPQKQEKIVLKVNNTDSIQTKTTNTVILPRVKPSETVQVKDKSGIPPEVKAILPSWIKKPWRYMIPDDPKLREDWLLTWSDFLISYCKAKKYFLVNISDIVNEFPFKNPIHRTKLSTDHVILLGDYLVEKKRARWWNEELKDRIRIYWKTLAEHADDFYDYAFLHGLDLFTAYDIKKLDQEWSNIPPREIGLVMRILVSSKRAKWADSDKKTIELNLL